MADDIFEDDELAAVKRWWKENYKAVLAGVVIAAIIIAFWYGWPAYKESQVEAGADVYVEEFTRASDDKNFAQTVEVGQRLMSDHDSTVYASYAAMELAKLYYTEQDDPAKAIEKLRWVVDNGDEAYQTYARLQLASLLVDQGKASEAKALLAEEPLEGVEARWLERRGDALLALGENDAAKAAYSAALDNEPVNAESIEYKLYNIGNNVVVLTPEAEEQAESVVTPTAEDAVDVAPGNVDAEAAESNEMNEAAAEPVAADEEAAEDSAEGSNEPVAEEPAQASDPVPAETQE